MVVITKVDTFFFCSVYIRGLSGKYADTVNSEAKTSNNMELLFFVL